MSETWVGIIVAIAIGLGTIAVAVLIGWWQIRKSNPKRQLTYELDVTPLISRKSVTAAKKVQVSVSGQQLSNPHVVRLTVRSTSRVDIPSDIFDGHKTLNFDLNTPIHEILEGNNSQISLDQGPSTISLVPQLIRPGDKAFMTVVTDGSPRDVSVSKTLIDTLVTRSETSELFPLRKLILLMSTAVVSAACTGSVITYSLYSILNLFQIIAVISGYYILAGFLSFHVTNRAMKRKDFGVKILRFRLK